MKFSICTGIAAAGLFACAAFAQGTLADYQRGQELQRKARGLVVNAPGPATWIGDTDHFWYYRSVQGGTEFLLVDAATASKKPAFNQEKLAAAINTVSGGHYTALALPFAPAPGGRGGGGGGRGAATTAPLTFLDLETAIQFGMNGFLWKCSLSEYTCAKGDVIPPPAGRGGAGPEAEDAAQPVPMEIGGDPADGLAWEPPAPPQEGAAGRGGR